jgi:CTD small phosphatase-like protein 2
LDETLIWTDKDTRELANNQGSLRISIRPYTSSFL